MEETLFEKPNLTDEEKYLISPFFTNLDKSVYAFTFLPPEVAGALCSRASRAKEDLRTVFLKEFVKPFLELDDDYKKALDSLIKFLHQYPIDVLFANPKARDFYIKWLAEYGDDSIAQMAGTWLVYSSLSQIAIKHFENQRIGLAPIEKSTRYVDFSSKIENHYRYFVPPEINKMGLKEEYEKVMDEIFDSYLRIFNKTFDYFKKNYPEEKELVLKSKAFDICRLILPLSTLSQVAFYGNGQSFEYMINRSLNHHLEEIRWAGKRAYEELLKIIPSFLRRIEKEESYNYRKYLGERISRTLDILKEINWQKEDIFIDGSVKLIEYDAEGENKIIAGLLYPYLREPYQTILEKIKKLDLKTKEKILDKILHDRRFRWYKVPRAFEFAYLKFEILLNIGAWRDLQRHRMQTQIHQIFTIHNGFDLPEEFKEFGEEDSVLELIKKIEDLYRKIAKNDVLVSQYSVLFCHKVRFIQYQNLRQFFWETELRTTPQGHPDYRKIEQDKAKIIQKIYPLISKYLLVDFNEYYFARRGEKEKEERKKEELKKFLENV